jgi:ribosomal-protein-alanine N-acetyltransferase
LNNSLTINTKRLILREFSHIDAEPLYQLNTNPEVMRYTGDLPFADVTSAALFIDSYTHYSQYGFGRWAIIHRETEEFMGFCGLRHSETSSDTDLGFRLFQRYWARGYATEAATAALTAGFHQYGLKNIIGKAVRENLPSITVLQKLGMRFRELTEENDLFWLIYSISSEKFDLMQNTK